jgi:hypothetical protein
MNAFERDESLQTDPADQIELPGWRNLMSYRRLGGYRYLLAEDFALCVPIFPRRHLAHPFIELSVGGTLLVRRGYAWDGASGPSVNTSDFIRGSLVHDALYQLMREGLLDGAVYRPVADSLLRRICQFDGMPRLRSWWVWAAVRFMGSTATLRRIDVRDKILQAP